MKRNTNDPNEDDLSASKKMRESREDLCDDDSVAEKTVKDKEEEKVTDEKTESSCIICDGEGKQLAYGIWSCYKCRDVFNKFKNCPEDLICEFENCPVVKDMSCKKCRLQQCFRKGMKKPVAKTVRRGETDINEDTILGILELLSSKKHKDSKTKKECEEFLMYASRLPVLEKIALSLKYSLDIALKFAIDEIQNGMEWKNVFIRFENSDSVKFHQAMNRKALDVFVDSRSSQ